jgi:CubicO group peptidase (beta-lactamase class C family)
MSASSSRGVIPLVILVLTGALRCVPAANVPEEELARSLDDTLPARMQRLGIPGAAVGLVRDGKLVWSKGYGTADRSRGTAFTPDTVIRAASVSKALCAWGVMRLVEQGVLDLDAPVEKYLTSWKLPDSEFDHRQVTLRRALSHTAGLVMPGRLGVNRTLREVLNGFPGGGPVRLIREPGSRFQYSNAGYNLVQALMEDVTGESYAVYMQRTVLAPLAMKDSSFDGSRIDRARLATGYMVSGESYPDIRFAEQASGGLYTTVKDLAIFVAAAMPGPNGEPPGRGILRPETISRMMHAAPETGGAYGLGYETRNLGDGHVMAAHNGRLAGWSSRIAVLPDKRTGLVIGCNGDAGFALLDEALCPWLDCAAGLRPMRPCGIWSSLSAAVWVLSTGLMFLLVRYLMWQRRRGRRRAGRWQALRSVARGVLMAVIGLLWVLVWHTDIVARQRVWMRGFEPAMVMPESFGLLSAVVVAWCLLVAAVSLRRGFSAGT